MIRHCSPVFALALVFAFSSPASADLLPDKDEDKKDEKKDDEDGCSVDSPESNVAALAALALLISAASLRRRRG